MLKRNGFVALAAAAFAGLMAGHVGAVTTAGAAGDGKPTIVYNPANGNITIDTDGKSANTYILQSVSGIFTGDPPSFIGGTIFQTDTNNEISENFFSPTLTGVRSIGNVAAPSLTSRVSRREAHTP